MSLPLSRPDITDAEVQEVLGVLKTPWLSLGPKLEEFETMVAGYTKRRHAVAVSSGTAALHLAGRALGFTDGVEVITTPFTFAATSNVLLIERSHPVFVDVDPSTLNLDPVTVAAFIEREYRPVSGHLVRRSTGRPLAGILPVAVFGHPIDADGFRALADAHSLKFLRQRRHSVRILFTVRVSGSVGAPADAAVFGTQTDDDG
jgi:perosamine synthetase